MTVMKLCKINSYKVNEQVLAITVIKYSLLGSVDVNN